MSRKFTINNHPEINGLFRIDELSNPKFDEEIFVHDEKSRRMNIFPSYEEAIKFIEENIPGKKEIHIMLIYN